MSAPTTIVEAARALRCGEVTPQHLVTSALERIDRLDAQVNAWVMIDATGAAQAAERAAEELAAGRDRGPLHGIPLGIKDIVDVVGMPTRAGSRLTDPSKAAADATVVERLRAAGAIILGKTVTTEFACFDPSPTRNPWNLEHTPGGSSSGSAAAVALGMCFGAIASQTGGSITRPASYCGVAGCKPTFGRVSRTGVVPVGFHLDHVGVIARTAADCAVMLAAIAGDDPRDPAAVPRESLEMQDADTSPKRKRGSSINPPSLALRASVQPGATAGLPSSANVIGTEPPRLGVLVAYFFEQADAGVVRLTRQAIETLKEGGASAIDVELPTGFDRVHVMHRRLMAAEAADFHRRAYGAYPPSPPVGEGGSRSEPGEGAALPVGSPIRSAYGPKLAELLDEGFATSIADYQEALVHQALFRNSVARSLTGIDALVTPATPTAAPASLTTTGDPRFNSPWSHAGVPTVSIPIALASAGLPVALQLIGPAWSEARLLMVAAWCEERLNFRAMPPMAQQ